MRQNDDVQHAFTEHIWHGTQTVFLPNCELKQAEQQASRIRSSLQKNGRQDPRMQSFIIPELSIAKPGCTNVSMHYSARLQVATRKESGARISITVDIIIKEGG